MKLDALQQILGPDYVATDPETLLVYGSDASRLAGECLAVVWPENTGQIAQLVEWAGSAGADLVPRGAGTGLCGGATPQGSVVVDFSRLTWVGQPDLEKRQVAVGAGLALDTLNGHLSRSGLFLPVVPGSHRAASIGGMIATNAAGLHAVRYGTMQDWVVDVTLVDGLGRTRQVYAPDLGDVVGREGVTGFITAATLRLAAPPGQRSLSLVAFESHARLLEQRAAWMVTPGLVALEYLNSYASAAIGWPAYSHLLAEWDSRQGVIHDPVRVAEIWRQRDTLYPALAQAGYPAIEDPQLEGDGLAELLEWLDDQCIPTFGHLGMGILHPCFRPNDGRVAEIYRRVHARQGKVSGEHGIGLKKRGWVGESFCATIARLKAAYDPAGIINGGKLC